MDTKLAIAIYTKILRSGVVRRSIYFGMLVGTLLYIAIDYFCGKWIQVDSEWYVWMAVGFGILMLFRIVSYLISPLYIKSEERRLNDGSSG